MFNVIKKTLLLTIIFLASACKTSFKTAGVLNKNFYNKVKGYLSSDYEIDISKICKNNNLFKIDLIANNPKSLFDLRIGLNRKKRSIILNEIVIVK